MPLPSRIRRVRTLETNADAARPEAEKLLQSIAAHQLKANDFLAIVKQNEEKLFDLMRKSRMDTIAVDEATASITRAAGKTQNIVDAKELYEVLEPKNFFECVSVSITKAKEFLGSKELATITKSVPGTPGEPKLKVVLK